jgi:antitoxin (DNA-binding transcriptional repressor) of toxin-antitoxin stability system
MVWSLLTVVLGAVRAGEPVIVELAREGQPAATIVVAEKPTRAAQLAAAELQEHVRLISGATLPVVNDAAEVKGLRILVGESKGTQVLGLKKADLKPQEYLIRFLPDTLVLMGRDKDDYAKLDYTNPDGKTIPDLFDDHATCYAVYDLLERHCGVRWYLPTQLGTVYDATPTLKVTGTERRRTPSMEYRNEHMASIEYATTTGYCRFPADFIGTQFGGEPGPLPMREHALFAHRLRLGGKRLTPGGHSHYSYFKRFWGDDRPGLAKYFERRRPELFAQGYNPTPESQLCWTSQEVVDQTVQDIRDYFKLPDHSKPQNPNINQANVGDEYYGLGAMDTDQWCQCPRCNAIIRKNAPPGSARYDKDRINDYWFQFVNRVAQGIQKTDPDKRLIALAYNQYSHPPTFKLEPNVAIVQVFGPRCLWDTAADAGMTKLIDEWVKESDGARPRYLWLHFLVPVAQATYANPLWYPFPGFFGHKVVEQMKRYRQAGFRGMVIETSASSHRTYAQRLFLWDQLEMQLTWQLAFDPDQDGNKLIDEFFARYYGAAARPMQAFYETAEAIYCDPASYPAGATAGTGQTPYVAWECLGNPSRMEKLGQLMDDARAACRTDLERKRVALFDKGIWQVMRKGYELYAVQRAKANATMQSAETPCLDAPPDGDPRKLDWTKAGVLANWGSMDGKPTPRKIDARIAHDGKKLYLRLQENVDTSKIVRDAHTVWSGDDWEVFVARRNSLGEPYRQIGVDAKGQSADLSYNVTDQGLIQDAGAKVYSDTSAADCWRVFLAIPLDRLLPGRAVTRPGESVSLNIVRATCGSAETAAMWIATMTASFHELDRLGRVFLLPPGVQHENRILQPGFEEVVPLNEDTEGAFWLKEARASKLDVGAEWCMAWIPNVFGPACDGESLRIGKGEAGKDVHSGRHALHVKGGKAGFHVYQSETGQGPDGVYRCRFFGRGTGKLTLSTYEYSNKPGSGCPAGHGLIQTFELRPEWQEFAGVYKPSPKSDAQFNFVLAVPPGTMATLDDFEFWKE